MHVALINKAYPPHIGGIEYHVRQLAINLLENKNITQIDILVANSNNQLSQEINDGIAITRVPSLMTLAATPIAPSMLKWFDKINADIYHFHFPYPFGDFAWLMSKCRKPYVITYHADILRQKFLLKLYKPVMYKFFDNASKIIVTSPNIIESSSVLQKYKEKTELVPLGIDPSPFKTIQQNEKVRSQYSNKPLILFVGRLVHYKGVDILVKAMKNIDANLLIIGTGLFKTELENIAKKLKISEKIHFLPAIQHELVPLYFNACDIFVLPSISESYGLVQLEAHACAKPVISTDLPTGVPFVNKHGLTGLIVKPGDVESLANALNELVSNVELRKKLGNQAQKRMLSEFTSYHMTEKILGIYTSILK